LPLTLIASLPLEPSGIAKLATEVVRLKLGATTVTEIVVALLKLPEAPVIVIE
jgi:hypothetical protein